MLFRVPPPKERFNNILYFLRRGKRGTLLRARSFKLRLEHDLFFIYRKFLESRKNWRRINSVTLQGFCPPCGNRQDTKRNERAVCLLLLFFASEIIRPCGAETVCDGLTEQSVGAELY